MRFSNGSDVPEIRKIMYQRIMYNILSCRTYNTLPCLVHTLNFALEIVEKIISWRPILRIPTQGEAGRKAFYTRKNTVIMQISNYTIIIPNTTCKYCKEISPGYGLIKFRLSGKASSPTKTCGDWISVPGRKPVSGTFSEPELRCLSPKVWPPSDSRPYAPTSM